MLLRRVGWSVVVGAGLASPLLWGCGPSVDEDDLGTVVEEVPEVPGSDKPFEMPELGPPPPPEHPEFEGLEPP